MASTPEKKVKDAVVKILKAHGAYYFFPVTGGFGRSGVPDIIVCHKGYFIGIECKAGTNKATALQEQQMEKIRTAGGIAFVIYENNIPHVTAILESVEAIQELRFQGTPP